MSDLGPTPGVGNSPYPIDSTNVADVNEKGSAADRQASPYPIDSSGDVNPQAPC